jgi:vanillate/3-O-methylgallate O-demethylase
LGFPLPAIYTGEATRAYREWLPGDGWEARFQLAGSFRPDSIEDYYVSPFALGYGKIIKFDHDFIGREALEGVDRSRERRKVTLHWNADDVSRVFASLMEPELPFKYIQLPLANYGFQQRDVVRTLGGDLVGLSARCGYTGNENAMLSLAMIDPGHAEFGTELVLTWGEPNGGSRKPHVERHRQAEIRVTVAPAPYAKPVQEWKGV